MRKMIKLVIVATLLGAGFVHSQEHRFITPPGQVVAIRAGKVFDSRSGTLLNNQIILIRGERIAETGSSVQIPGKPASST